jgi:hypothetical protein
MGPQEKLGRVTQKYMAKDPQVALNRIMYNSFRKSVGAPPMQASKFGGRYYVETDEGEMMLEQCDATDIWDARIRGVTAWGAKYGTTPEKTATTNPTT